MCAGSILPYSRSPSRIIEEVAIGKRRPHALVTGASAGLGEAFAREFAANGYNVTLVARREERLRALAGELDVETFVRPADLSNGAVVGPLVADAIEALGPIDVLINNAGIQYVEPTVGVSPERIEKMFAVNVTTPFALQNAVLGPMLDRGDGSIINIASVGAITPTPGMCHYAGSKAALAATSESLRGELRKSGVNILTVYPGPVETDMEATAREGYPDSFATQMVPVGTPAGLAKRVFRAHRKKKARVVYPAIYGLTRYFRIISEWITRTFTPAPIPRDER